jgi:hypothetical protein
MAFLVDQSGNHLVDQSSNALVTTGVADVGTTFPLMLMMRLRLHAAWLLFMLIPT